MKKGQTIIEYALALLIASVITQAFLGLWNWSVGHIPARQDQFEGSRAQAGQNATAGTPPFCEG